jgi:hypothetical protein
VQDGVFWFGKHRGQRITAVPSSYLRWVYQKCADLDADFRELIRAELARRAGGHAQGAGAGAGGNSGNGAAPNGAPPNFAALVARCYREACLKFHPDRGGSNEAMAAVNDMYERLKQLMGE